MSERRLKGRYQLRSILGCGLATTTHLALDHETGERCVVKVLSLASADALKAHELLMREARVLQRLEHPRIPRLVDFFTEEDGPETRVCLVQQHVDGKSLLELVRAGRRFDEAETLALGVKLARVLEYLHGFERPILHRDVKPANVLVTPGERVYLVDFGAVRDFVPHELLHPSGPTVVGTRGYMPIEQFEGEAVPGSDLYALGATLVFALSGKEPAELGKQGLRLDFTPHVSVSAGFARLLARLLEPDWRERPLSATEVREALEQLVAQASRPRPRPRPTRPWLAALMAAVAVLAMGIAFLSRQGPRSSATPAGAGHEPTASFWTRWFSGPQARRDTLGDPLPPHALRRLGSARFHHGGPVRGVAFTPDGASLVSAGADDSVSVWSTASGAERGRFEMGEPVSALALSPDGERVLVGAERFWTARLFALDGRPLARLFTGGEPNAPSVAVSEVAWSGDSSLFATRTHAAIDLWSGEDGRHRRRLAQCGHARGLAFVGSRPLLLVACADRAIRLFDVASGEETRRLELQSSYLPLAVSPDGRLVADVDYGRVQLIDLVTGARATALADAELQASQVSAFSFSSDGTTAVAGLHNGKAVVWDVATGARRLVLPGHVGSVRALDVSRDGRWLASGGDDGLLQLFDLRSGQERHAGAGHRGAATGFDFLPGTDALVSTGQDGALVRWDGEGRAETLRSFAAPARAVFALSASRMVVVEERLVHVYDVASGWEVASAVLSESSHGGIAVAPSAQLLAVGGASTLDVIDLASGVRRSFPVTKREDPVAFSPDGRALATLREEPDHGERPLVLRDTASGSEISTSPPLKGGAFHFRCRSPEGNHFGFNGALRRLDSDSKRRFENLGWPGRPWQCAVSPDGRYVASARDREDTIELLERVQGAKVPELRHLATLAGHRGPVTALAFAPDSRTLVSGGADSSLLLWDTASLDSPAEAPPTPSRHAGPRVELRFDDGIGGPGIATVRLPAGSPLQLVPGRIGRALRPGVWLGFPETRAVVLGDEFTLTLFFQVEPGALGAGVHQVLTSELVTLDVRDGGKAFLFFHFLNRGGHSQAELTPWIGRVQPGRFYHVGVSYRRSEGQARVCVDGVCGPGPTGTSFSDRLGELVLARANQPNFVSIDELAVYDRAFTDDQIAVAAGLTRSTPLPSPTPPPTPTPLPRLPAEAEPLPREAPPEGKDVAAHVSVEERSGFTVYRFGGPLARAQTLDLDLGMGALWVGTSLGLLRHDPRTGSWRQWDETSALPGARLNEIAVVAGRVIVDSSTPSGAHSVLGTGVHAFDVASRTWTPMKDVGGSVWDLWGDGATLWVGTGSGAEARDLATGVLRRFTHAAGELVNDTVHAVRRHGDTVAFAAMGDWVQEKKGHEGGGVTLWDRGRNRFRSYTLQDGLARGYSCDVFLDDREAFVAHWEEELGLSRIDLRSGRVEVLRRSANGIDLGGVVLAGEPETLWIGQQGALVRLDRASRQATALRENDGLPGYIVSAIAIGEDAVWVSLYAYGQDGVRSAGVVRFPRR